MGKFHTNNGKVTDEFSVAKTNKNAASSHNSLQSTTPTPDKGKQVKDTSTMKEIKVSSPVKKANQRHSSQANQRHSSQANQRHSSQANQRHSSQANQRHSSQANQRHSSQANQRHSSQAGQRQYIFIKRVC